MPTSVPGEVRVSAHPSRRPFFARTVRVLAIPVIVFWALLAISTNTFIHKWNGRRGTGRAEVPTYAPSQVAMLQIGEKFQESKSTSLTMVVLEADIGHRTNRTTSTTTT